jgi:signal transduction histidine kinase
MVAEIPAITQEGALRFLLIEDNAVDVKLLKHELQRAGFEFTLAVVQTPDDFTRELRTAPPHVVMADYNLPSWTGMEGLEILSREGLDVPFILITGALGEVIAVDCIKQGATDYVLKNALTRLPVAVRRALQEKRLRDQRRDAENALEQSRRNQLRFRDEFLSHVAHEIRSPLTAIMQFTNIILDGLAGEITEEQRQFEQIVLQSTYQIRSMIDTLLEVTRLEGGNLIAELQKVDLSDAVADTLKRLNTNALAREINLLCEVPPGLPAAYADKTRLREILFNLVDNAIKFTPFGGTVNIQVRLSEEDSGFLCIRVADTGSGIEPTKIESIFERLYGTLDDCRPTQNLGLGLFICKGLVTLQGGRIWVESELQKGSTFSFTLPVFSSEKLIQESQGTM